MSKKFLFVLDYFDGLGFGGYGGAQRSQHIIMALQEIGICDVALIRVPRDEGTKKSLTHIKGMLQPSANLFPFYKTKSKKKGFLIYRAFRSLLLLLKLSDGFSLPSVNEKYFDVKRVANELSYDAIVVRYFQAGVCTDLFNFSTSPIILDVDDNPLEIIETNAKVWMKKIRLISLFHFLTKKWMESILKKCEFAWWIKKEELIKFPCCKGSVLQNIPVFPVSHIRYKKLLEEQLQLNILFVGVLRYKPNSEGISIFLKEIWPKVLRKVGTATLDIVGMDADCNLTNLMNSTLGVTYHGFQKDLNDFYSKATISICPTYQGAGSKIKILESMAYERPAIVTPHAFEGLKEYIEPGTGLLIADTTDEFANIIIELWNNPDFALEVARKGYFAVHKYFSKERFTQIVHDGVRSVCANHSQGLASNSLKQRNNLES